MQDIAILLVPGICLTRAHFSSFVGVAERLNISISVVDLPSASGTCTEHDFDLDVAAISEELETLLQQRKRVLVVAHSYGGLPASQAVATASRPVLGLTFVSAFVPQHAFSLVGLREGKVAGPFAFKGNQCSITEAPERLFNRCPEHKRTSLTELLVPHSVAVLATPTMSNDWKMYPRSYVKCGEDKMLVIAEQDENIARLDGGIVFEIPDGDHFPFASRPYELLRILVRICI